MQKHNAEMFMVKSEVRQKVFKWKSESQLTKGPLFSVPVRTPSVNSHNHSLILDFTPPISVPRQLIEFVKLHLAITKVPPRGSSRPLGTMEEM